MSQQRRCSFFKTVDATWFMTLGNFEYAEEEHDCTTFGPFASEQSAIDFLDDNFSNPGGWSTDDSGTRAVPANAVSPRRARGW